MPPFSMSAPAKMKPTTASSGNMSMTLHMSRAMMLMGMLLKKSTATEATPRETKMGQPTMRHAAMTIHRRRSVIC